MINGYTRQPLKAEDVYVLHMLLAHNGIDRTDERFSEKALKDISDTLPGKALLDFHRRESTDDVLGRLFASKVGAPSAEELELLNAEDLVFPPDVEPQVVKVSAYMLRAGNESILLQVDGGILSWVSVGFDADRYKYQSDEEEGGLRYWDIPGSRRGA